MIGSSGTTGWWFVQNLCLCALYVDWSLRRRRYFYVFFNFLFRNRSRRHDRIHDGKDQGIVRSEPVDFEWQLL